MSLQQVCGPALFFWVRGRLLWHGCTLQEAENYGDFLNYPQSHDRVWEQHCAKTYRVDFDYYPRGRVVYRKTDSTFLIYYDKCMEAQLDGILATFRDARYELCYDEHYRCHRCNEGYVR
ncbi:MAG: hypothetical protein IJO50_05335 [Clostridia bacterium]|nr:hypothetical protein [Clostridia bacterium]